MVAVASSCLMITATVLFVRLSSVHKKDARVDSTFRLKVKVEKAEDTSNAGFCCL